MKKIAVSAKKSKKAGAKERPGTKTTQPQGDFGRYIQDVIDRKGFSQGEVAGRGGIDTGNITNMIGGSKRNPEFNTIWKLAIGLKEPYLRVCAALLSKEQKEREDVKEYWFDDRLMLIDDLLAQISPLERMKVEVLINALEHSLLTAHKENIGKIKRERLEAKGA